MYAIQQHRKLFSVSRLRQMVTGGRTVDVLTEGYSTINRAPCPSCHGNDHLSNIREGWGILQIQCDRCKEDFWT